MCHVRGGICTIGNWANVGAVGLFGNLPLVGDDVQMEWMEIICLTEQDRTNSSRKASQVDKHSFYRNQTQDQRCALTILWI